MCLRSVVNFFLGKGKNTRSNCEMHLEDVSERFTRHKFERDYAQKLSYKLYKGLQGKMSFTLVEQLRDKARDQALAKYA